MAKMDSLSRPQGVTPTDFEQHAYDVAVMSGTRPVFTGKSRSVMFFGMPKDTAQAVMLLKLKL